MTVTMCYRLEANCWDSTTYNGTEMYAFAWQPPQWPLRIETEIIELVLPITIDSAITEAEQVTPEVVDGAGVMANDPTQFERWVYFPTPDEPSGKTYLCLLYTSRCV